MATIIERKYWQRDDGRTASLYGAVPWTSDSEKARWVLVTVGYTVQWEDGTIGGYNCKWPTREEGEAFLHRCPRR